VKITVRQAKGNVQYPRYVLVAENQTYFDGKGWTPDEKKALKYASLRAIKDEWKRLSKEMKERQTVLEAKIRITVNKPLTKEDVEKLAWFMSSASGFTLDYTKSRPPGLEDACISSQLVWSSLKRTEA
jgi:hypothetical protein